jgi:hypothetical protein
MSETEFLISNFLEFSKETNQMLNVIIDSILDEYKGTAFEKEILKKIGNVSEISETIDNKMSSLDDWEESKQLKILDEVENLMEKRAKIVSKMRDQLILSSY